MDNESEVIHMQMAETRASLTEKIETLEHQVVETVQYAKSAVTETVASVRDAVHDTVETVKDTVQDTLGAVKETFNLSRQVQRHPWAMLGGSAALGFVLGHIVAPARSSEVARRMATSSNGQPMGQAFSGAGPSAAHASHERAPSQRKESWLTKLAERFEPELSRLRGLAIGTVLGVVRNMTEQAAPGELGHELARLIDDVTNKVGGRPVDLGDKAESSHPAGTAPAGTTFSKVPSTTAA